MALPSTDSTAWEARVARAAGALAEVRMRRLGWATGGNPLQLLASKAPHMLDKAMADARAALEAAANHRAATLVCFDCHRPYDAGPEFSIDPTTGEQVAPFPDGGGALCITCLHDRLVAAGIGDATVPLDFATGPLTVRPPSELVRVLEAASHALRSYQYGNAATDLAKGVADACDLALANARGDHGG